MFDDFDLGISCEEFEDYGDYLDYCDGFYDTPFELITF